MILYLGMAVGIGMDGVNSQKQTDTLRQSVQDMISKISNFTETYNNVITNNSQDIAKMNSDMQDDVNAITQLSATIQVQKNEHAATYKTIQILGVTMILFIAFIFILKIFGFYEVVQEMLIYPFKKIFSKN